MPTKKPQQNKPIWYKLAEESDTAFAAFKQYRDMGPDRSIAKLQEKLGKQPTYKRQLSRWSADFSWVKRAEAYDADQDEKAQVLLDAAFKEQGTDWATRQIAHREKTWLLSEKLIQRAERMLKYPLVRKQKSEDGKVVIISPARWAYADINKLIETADKLARLAAEMPTSVIKFLNLLDKKGLDKNKIFAELSEEFEDLETD